MKKLGCIRTLPAYLIALILCAACSADNQNQTTAVTTVTPPPVQNLQLVPRPQKIMDLMQQRGEQDQAMPTLKVVSPANNAVINGSTVPVRLTLTGDLKGYQPHKDPATNSGNHIHVILDNQPYEAYYELDQPFELRNVSEGKHTLRVFPSRPWHESYKNEGAFQIITFTVKGGGDPAKPTTTNTGQTVANSASPSPSTREGKDVASSTAGEVDLTKPLLTYSRPKGEYKGGDADALMIDLWLSNVKLKGDGGEYSVRYIIDDDDPKVIDKWVPIWFSGWTNGKHIVRLELLDKDQRPVENGGYNTTTREITVVK
ncbi:MAG TPA: hypothetical protein VJU86_18850 [Pyrinomonadaceae bacterium]|nr:hypothetical protein [Pyrinomonadaceae bacterium]